MDKLRRVKQVPHANQAGPSSRAMATDAFTEQQKRCFDRLVCSKGKSSKTPSRTLSRAAMSFDKSLRVCAKMLAEFFNQCHGIESELNPY
jgi:hypothetical protein